MRNPLRGLLLAAAIVQPGLSHAQLSLPELEARLKGEWTLAVQGESRTRTLKVNGITEKGAGNFVFNGSFGLTDAAGAGRIIAPQIATSAAETSLSFGTPAKAQMSVQLQPDGKLDGTAQADTGEVKRLVGIKVPDAVAGKPSSPIQIPTPPIDEAFANENTDWKISAPGQTHAPPYGTRTPTSIPVGRKITTYELRDLLARYKQYVAVIDVLNSNNNRNTIPGASWMPGAGENIFSGAEKERYSAALRKIADGDLTRPLVFLCVGAECWESYNAALHAAEAGFKDILWYRGGTNAWREAKLPFRQAAKIDW